MRLLIILSAGLLLAACSPLKTSPNDEKHQLELTLHELQTNLDDLRHDINCFQTELQILDGRIKYYENTLTNLKQQGLEKQHSRIEQLGAQVQSLEKKCLALERVQKEELTQVEGLSSHADETTASLQQFKTRIFELQQEIGSQNRKFDKVAEIQTHVEMLMKNAHGDFKVYRVRPGDSLEKIAKNHKTTALKIKKLNHLEQDLIVVGQELKIPLSS